MMVGPRFIYHGDTPVVCGICQQSVTSAVWVDLNPDKWQGNPLNICDDCLMKLLAVVPASIAESRQTIGELVARFKQNPGRLSE